MDGTHTLNHSGMLRHSRIVTAETSCPLSVVHGGIGIYRPTCTCRSFANANMAWTLPVWQGQSEALKQRHSPGLTPPGRDQRPRPN